MTAAQLLHAHAGSPQLDKAADESALCYLCAQSWPRTLRVGDWAGSSFTDQNKARIQGSDRVCEPCAWCCSWVAPPGYVTAADAKRGPNLRMFSHCYAAGEYAFWHKGQKPQLRAWLRGPKSPPWWCAISDSGQKHVIPWTPINYGDNAAGVVRFEEANVVLTDQFWHAVDVLTDALTAGLTKAEIETGRYSVRSWTSNATALQDVETTLGGLRGSRCFALALWLAQREEKDGHAESA